MFGETTRYNIKDVLKGVKEKLLSGIQIITYKRNGARKITQKQKERCKKDNNTN